MAKENKFFLNLLAVVTLSGDARRNDLKTLRIIENFDYQSLFGLGNDYLDSPASLALLLLLMEKSGHTHFEVWQHTNSGELLNDEFSEVTSYFSIAFY